MGQIIEVMVEGGRANPGPLGPTLGPTGVNIGQVVQEINKATAEYNGMQVPVKIELDDKKNFTVSVGTPPASALIKARAGLESGSGNARTTMVGNISLDDAIAVAGMKGDDLLGGSLKARVREVVGTCVSMGVTVEGADPREFNRRIGAGEFDSRLQ